VSWQYINEYREHDQRPDKELHILDDNWDKTPKKLPSLDHYMLDSRICDIIVYLVFGGNANQQNLAKFAQQCPIRARTFFSPPYPKVATTTFGYGDSPWSATVTPERKKQGRSDGETSQPRKRKTIHDSDDDE